MTHKYDKLLNTKEIAAMLNVTTSTIYGWVSQGKIPHMRMNGLIKFRLSAIQAWLKRKEFDHE